MPVTYSGRLQDWYTSLAFKNLTTKNTSSFLLSVVFKHKCVEVLINDFAMCLIISKCLRRQKCKSNKTKQ